jgi:hypothetical protein
MAMTPLRRRMIEDMNLAGLASGSQQIYIKSVRRLAAHYRRSPDELSEEEVRSYLIRLRERGAARGTFKADHYGIRFLYHHTLGRDWPRLLKKDSSADAEAPPQCPGRSTDPPAARLCRKSDPQGLPLGSLRLRPAHQRGHDS